MKTQLDKLCKELKEAGFPQDTQWKIDEVNCKYLQYEKINCDNWACPTLSELIEACGEGLSAMLLVDDEWVVGREGMPFSYLSEKHPQSKGKTLEIAVANLYLEINKPSQASKDYGGA